MNKLLTIDRMEDATAVCKDDAGTQYLLAEEQLPPGSREGDCLRKTSDGWRVDREETDRRREKNRDLYRRLCKKLPPQS